ncbi:MAG TPA: YihY/virulence factor BrkB family protein [Adhaeribacter sp.]|nr:YihY/virulence factor BrkB family protein [Adhaeribacter sp.]
MSETRPAIWTITKETFKEFADDNPLDYAAIIGFYTIFSLPAVLIIIMRVAGTFFGQEAVRGELVTQISGIIGRKTAEQVQSIIENASMSDASTIGTIIGFATMAFSATTVFIALQDSLNAMWNVKAKPEKGWLKLIVNRVLSLAMVVSMGFLLLVSLSVDVLLGIVKSFLEARFSGTTVNLITAGNYAVSFLISILIFSVIFKTLPDVKIRWKNVWIGATVTTFLFVIGRFMLNLYFRFDPLADTYGAAGSLVLILVWVFYTSIIFLLGAEFTQVYARLSGDGIQPAEHAVKVVTKELERDVPDTQER